ncbi:MAG: hypothetical protein PG981_000406 [Wolbachia endosymbiont of Ctenocephalides orientis wCori]|nr:MAG: hypothetical protein PG981_000406 [Wolbachia endosymbiont of Ctenocephalides orientis wCori]
MTITLMYRFENSSYKIESFDDVSKLVDFLKKNTNITLLELGWNNLGKEGAEALVPALKEMKNLTSLYLNGNNLEKEDAQKLAMIFQVVKYT